MNMQLRAIDVVLRNHYEKRHLKNSLISFKDKGESGTLLDKVPMTHKPVGSSGCNKLNNF